MEDSSLQDRLRAHAKAFDGLLSLIPAKMYYGEDTSEQWQKKKQTKEEAAAARRGKLDPDSELNRNAKEVMDERARNKWKLREMLQQNGFNSADEEDSDQESISPHAVHGVEAEKPGEGLRKTPAKKQKVDDDVDKSAAEETHMDVERDKTSNAQQPRLTKREAKLVSKRERKRANKADRKTKRAEERVPSHISKVAPTPSISIQAHESEAIGASPDVDSTISSPSQPDQPVESTNGATNETISADTSISSNTSPSSQKSKQIKIPADTTALRARLAAKIEALRAARKADGPDGKPIRTRQELIEARRAKEEQRKKRKNELKRLAKLEEAKKREEALASNSPGVVGSPATELEEPTGNFSFGRVVFGDGSQMSHDLSYVRQQGKKKGPSDAKTALLKVQNQKKRLEELDADKREDVANKEAWLTARRRAEGDKIRNDELMLKKTVKRKEAAKKKSEKAWREREQGVEMAKKERQKKREENLRKRRDEKLSGKSGKKKSTAAKKKKGGRPGFEGSFGVGGRRK